MFDDSKKVLYVDDEETNLEMFSFYMKRRFHVHVAQSGPKGLEILKNNPEIAIVFSDMKMPEMNGMEFIKKANEIRDDLIFIILTGYDITPDIAEALKSGLVRQYFGKPYNLKEIEATIRAL